MTGKAALLGALGVVAIGFGLLSALMVLIQPLTDPLWIFGNLVLGAVLLGTAVFMSLDSLGERIRSGEGRRASKYGSSAIVSAVLGIAILGLVGFLTANCCQGLPAVPGVGRGAAAARARGCAPGAANPPPTSESPEGDPS